MAHVCRDIKSANIMRPDSSRVKIGDLGVAKVLKGAMTKTQIGTPHYMPPEVGTAHHQLRQSSNSARIAKFAPSSAFYPWPSDRDPPYRG